MNVFEQLVSEWYEYQGYFVRRNNTIGHAELDALAYLPDKRLVVHIETGKDAETGPSVDAKILRKMRFLPAEYARALNCQVDDVKKIAIYGWQRTKAKPRQLGDVTVITLADFVRDINDTLKRLNTRVETITQNYPLLSAMQWSLWAEAKPRYKRSATAI